VPQIIGEPIVYSFGSNKQQDFEMALLKLRSDSKIYTFEIDKTHLPDHDQRIPGVEYFNIGLGYGSSNSVLMSIREIMEKLGHSYIDILKIDIEGHEFEFIENELYLLPFIGQLLIEVHNHRRTYDLDTFFNRIESTGMQMFFKEYNLLAWTCCSEFSFIQENWLRWNHAKKNKVFEIQTLLRSSKIELGLLIPHILHETYPNISKVPLYVYDNIRTNAQTWSHKIYTDKDGEHFLKTYFSQSVLSTFYGLEGVHKDYLLRYGLLYIYGGVYMDIKCQIMRTFESIFNLNNTLYTVVSSVKPDAIFNGIIASPPGNLFFLTLMEHIVYTYQLKAQYGINYRDDVFVRYFKYQVKKNVPNYVKGFNSGTKINFFLMSLESRPVKECDRPDKDGQCTFIFSGDKKYFKTSYSSYPW